jgi:hypothetical protein
VVELAEHAVEQVSQGGGVPVAVGSSAVVVIFGWSWSGQGGEGPEESGGVEPVVFDTAAGDGDAPAGGAGDGGGAGVGLERAGVGEPGAVVPVSASTRAPVRSARPGKLVMIAWSGCWANVSVAATLSCSTLAHSVARVASSALT